MIFKSAAGAYLWAWNVREAHQAGHAQSYEPRESTQFGKDYRILDAYQILKIAESICKPSVCRYFSPDCLRYYLLHRAEIGRHNANTEGKSRKIDTCLWLLEKELSERGIVDPERGTDADCT